MQGLGSTCGFAFFPKAVPFSRDPANRAQIPYIYVNNRYYRGAQMTLRAFVSLSWQQRCNSGLSNQLSG
jgi:hypothetical protein